MKKILFLLISLFSAELSIAQDAKYLISVYSNTDQTVNQEAFINDDNSSYLIGWANFADTVFVDGPFNSIVHPANGKSIFYLIRASENGTIDWFKTYDSDNTTGSFYTGSGATDSEGNLYISGYVNGDFDYQPGVGTKMKSVVGRQAFVVKIDKAGEAVDFMTTSRLETSANAGVNKMSIAPNGNINICGYTSGKIDFDPSSGVHEGIGEYGNDGFFIASYEADFSFKWVHVFNPDNAEALEFGAIKDNSVVLIGEHNRTFDADPGSDTLLLGNSGRTNFIITVNEDGTFKNAGWLGTPFHETRITDARILIDGSLFLKGYFDRFTDLAPLVADTALYEGASLYNVFLDQDLKITWSDTNVYNSPILFFNPKTAQYSGFLGRFYASPLDFVNRIQIQPGAQNEIGPIIVDYSGSLGYGGFYDFKKGENGFQVKEIDANNDYIICAGQTNKALDFGVNAIKTHKGRYFDAIYFVLPNSSKNVSVSELNQESRFSVYPNPSGEILNIRIPNSMKNSKLVVSDLQGKNVLKTSISSTNSRLDLSGLNNGVYIITISTNENSETQKFVKQ